LSLSQLNNIQEEYFDILSSSPLSSRITVLKRDKFKIDFPDFNESAPARQMLQLFDKVSSFWGSNYKEIKKLLNQAKNDFIYIDQGQIIKGIRKYGCFFDGLLLSDQILVSASEYSPSQKDLSGPARVALLTMATYLANRDILSPRDGDPMGYIVPPTRCVDKEAEKYWSESSQAMALNCFSVLVDRQLAGFEELAAYIGDAGFHPERLNPDLARRIYSYRSADSFGGYAANYKKALREEQGMSLDDGVNPFALLFLDVMSRLAEFERFASDAYLWAHESAVPYPNDLALYEWWAEQSSKNAAMLIGRDYSENDLYKMAVESRALRFMQDMDLELVLDFLKTSPVEELRNDLNLSRSRIKRLPARQAQRDMDAIGQYIHDRLSEFQAKSGEELRRRKWDVGYAAMGMGASLLINILSAAFPPLSSLSYIFGASLHDLLKSWRQYQAKQKEISARPIATLARWSGA